MSLIRSFLIIQKIHTYINKRATGTREQFARKLNMSVSALNMYLREMKMLGFPIAYCKKNDSYYYTECSAFIAGFPVQLDDLNLLNRAEMKQCSLQNENADPSLYYLCLDPETGKRSKSEEPC